MRGLKEQVLYGKLMRRRERRFCIITLTRLVVRTSQGQREHLKFSRCLFIKACVYCLQEHVVPVTDTQLRTFKNNKLLVL